ncbi:MAG: hypothetical protein M1147_07635 [Nitrospirae bacterium]|nr:hypothetical protein [Nitrospirota bacterium]MCL5977981.1 hypothetical protein [Nitrospirota bacterium]
MKKLVCVMLILFLVAGCGGPTQLTYMELPKDKTLALKINGVTLKVVSFGYTSDWSEIEIAIANETNEDIYFDAAQVFLTSDKGYDLIPLKAHEINERVHRKTGKWVNPLTIGALVAGIAAIVAPSSKDRTTFARGALVLGGGALASEMSKRQTAEADVQRKEDLLLKSYKIPPNLQLGGILYYRSVEAAKGIKAFIKVKGNEEFFHIEF